MSNTLTTSVSSIIAEANKDKIQMKQRNTVLKTINVSESNYLALKALGQAGDSFNDVITRLLAVGSVNKK